MKTEKNKCSKKYYSNNSTICFKSIEGVEQLRKKLTIGKEYLFSDCLQEDKEFEVKWERRILDNIEKHPNSLNSLVTGNRYWIYCKEIENEYTQKQLIEFGNYLLSQERKDRLNNDKRVINSVNDTDLDCFFNK